MTAARSKDRFKIRLQALQVAAQLPEDPHKALRILEAARQIVIDGMDDDGGEVVSLVTSVIGLNSSNA